ncbi:MAG: hypothetical protein QM778_28050 [Myxococcales bacterium]
MAVLMETSALTRRTFLSLVGLSVLGAAARVHADDPIVVVVSAKSSQKDLSMGKLRRIFLNQATDDDDRNRFLPINAMAKSSLRVRFDQVVLDMSADEVGRYWVDQRIRGSQPPRTVPDFALVRGVVAKWPGAIAYLPASQLRADVKALAIDGHLPGMGGYPLR